MLFLYSLRKSTNSLLCIENIDNYSISNSLLALSLQSGKLLVFNSSNISLLQLFVSRNQIIQFSNLHTNSSIIHSSFLENILTCFYDFFILFRIFLHFLLSLKWYSPHQLKGVIQSTSSFLCHFSVIFVLDDADLTHIYDTLGSQRDCWIYCNPEISFSCTNSFDHPILNKVKYGFIFHIGSSREPVL